MDFQQPNRRKERILWKYTGHHKKESTDLLSEGRCGEAPPPTEGGEENLGDLEGLYEL